MNEILTIALRDKNLTSLEFRALFYIVSNIDDIYHERLKKDLEIKTNGTMSKIIKKLIAHGYISRTKKSTANKKGTGSYSYELLSIKSKVPMSKNMDTYFDDLYKIFNHFKEKINPKKINEVESIKNIRLMVYIDKYPIPLIIKNIDEISNNLDYKNTIRSISGLRKYIQSKE